MTLDTETIGFPNLPKMLDKAGNDHETDANDNNETDSFEDHSNPIETTVDTIENGEITEPVVKKQRQKIECVKCKRMILKSHMKRHIKANHKYRRTFSCNLYGCGRGFATKKKLEHHVVNDHEENIAVPLDKVGRFLIFKLIVFSRFVPTARRISSLLWTTSTMCREPTSTTARSVS